VPEPGAPADRTRSAPAAFGRGVSLVVANPGLLLAPAAFGGAVLAAVVGFGAGLFFLARGPIAAGAAAIRRGPAGFSDFLESLQEFVQASAGALLLGLVVLLAGGLLLTALAAWVRAGVTGSLAAADRKGEEGAPVSAFRHPEPGPLFFAAASRLFRAFFALINVYALAGAFLALVICAPLIAAFAAAAAGRTGLLVLCGLVFAVLALAAVVASAVLRVVYLVAGRVIAVEGLDALASVGRAIALVRAAPGRSATLYLLTVGGALAVGLAFVFPRMVLTLAASHVFAGEAAALLVTLAFIFLQTAAGLAYDLAVTGAFVALWPSVPEAALPEAPAP
jgi:hypothetical protein